MADVRPLVEAQDKATRSLIVALIRALLPLWRGLDFSDDDAVSDAAVRSAQLVHRAQREARLGMDAYNRRVYDRLDLELPELEKAVLDDYPRQGVSPEKVWERPARTYRKAVESGADDAEAREKALSKVENLARDEVNMARRDQAARTYGKTEKVIGYRRVIHPEMSSSGTCGLCIAAATRMYKKDDLLPIHPGCNCTVLPATAAHDPGEWMNAIDLDALYKSAGSTGAQDLSNVRVQEFVDGELGPMLTTYGDKIPEGETRPRRERRVPGGRKASSSPRPTYRNVDVLEQRIKDYRGRLKRLKGDDELTRRRRANIESAIRGTEAALREARAAA